MALLYLSYSTFSMVPSDELQQKHFLQTGYSSCHPPHSIKAGKDGQSIKMIIRTADTYAEKLHRKSLQYCMCSMPDCSVVKDVLAASFSVITVGTACVAELLHCLINRHVVRQNVAAYQQLQMMSRHTL